MWNRQKLKRNPLLPPRRCSCVSERSWSSWAPLSSHPKSPTQTLHPLKTLGQAPYYNQAFLISRAFPERLSVHVLMVSIFSHRDISRPGGLTLCALTQVVSSIGLEIRSFHQFFTPCKYIIAIISGSWQVNALAETTPTQNLSRLFTYQRSKIVWHEFSFPLNGETDATSFFFSPIGKSAYVDTFGRYNPILYPEHFRRFGNGVLRVLALSFRCMEINTLCFCFDVDSTLNGSTRGHGRRYKYSVGE